MAEKKRLFVEMLLLNFTPGYKADIFLLFLIKRLLSKDNRQSIILHFTSLQPVQNEQMQ